MSEKITVYTDALGQFLWWDGKLLEARRVKSEDVGFTTPIHITKNDIVHETSENIIDVKKQFSSTQ